MKISRTWLSEYVDYTGSTEELEILLTRTGLSVEAIETRGAAFDKVVVAQILESSQHPNADRLSVCRVDDGSGQPRQIVCGAKNYKVGDKVPLALPGAVLPGDFKIKTGKLRGVDSEGMLCSAKELRLADDADGLLILDSQLVPGTPIASVFPPETVIDLEITPNRSDWLSHVGIAREISVFTGLPVKQPAVPDVSVSRDESVASISAPQGCPYYTLRRIRGVKVGPSPAWLKSRLESVGLRSINNVVDVTNFVMFELGQPLHAFDAAKIEGAICVRAAKQDEPFAALDGKTYKLRAEHMVIADAARAVALAGVMGGDASGVSESTTDVLLESAIFQPSLIRRTARELGLHSDSSYRFERGVDPDGVPAASSRATALILEVAGGVADDVLVEAGTRPAAGTAVSLRHDRCRQLLGKPDLSDVQIEESLIRVGLGHAGSSAGVSTWTIPGFRAELLREVDLIEEVARVIGIEQISGRVAALIARPGSADAAYDFQMALRQKLVAQGFSEARTSTLVAKGALEESVLLKLKNPLGEDQSVLRPGLVPALLEALQRNLHLGAQSVRLFEIGRVFRAGEREENSCLSLVLSGRASEATWRGKEVRALDFFDAKGVAAAIVGKDVEFLSPEVVPAPFLVAVVVRKRGIKLGVIGQLAPAEARRLDARGPVLAGEIDIDVLLALESGMPAVSPVPKFPAMQRDAAVIVSDTTRYDWLVGILHSVKEPLLESVNLFDVYSDPSSERLPAGKKSLAISLTFRSPERTLMTEEVSAAFERLKRVLREELAADFRE